MTQVLKWLLVLKEKKKEEVAKAEQDYIENKKKFKDAVKDGTIDKTANPYYLEKYKEFLLMNMLESSIDVLKKI